MGFDFRIGSDASQSLARPELNTSISKIEKDSKETTLSIGKNRIKTEIQLLFPMRLRTCWKKRSQAKLRQMQQKAPQQSLMN